MREHTVYAISVYSWYEPGFEQSSFWSSAGYMPGGNTIDEAYTRVKQEIKKYSSNCDLSKVKFKITKVITTEIVEDELTGEDFSVLMLR